MSPPVDGTTCREAWIPRRVRWRIGTNVTVNLAMERQVGVKASLGGFGLVVVQVPYGGVYGGGVAGRATGL